MSDEASVNIGALQQRVFGVENSQRALSDSLSSLASRVETLFASLASKIEERSRPQYPLLISIGLFGLAVLSSVGWLAYAPIRENQADLKMAMVDMAKVLGSQGERFVSIRELDGRSGRTREEIARLNLDISAVEKITVPRGEHEEKWRSSERQFENQQRQIDDLKRFNTDLVSARDFIKNLDERMRSLERNRSP